jgi:hypothetical protein
MMTTSLIIWDFEIGERRGQMAVDVFRSDHLLHDSGTAGWRAHEALTERERVTLGLMADDEVVFTRV